MSYRAIPGTEQELEAFVRDVLERLDRIEAGGLFGGVVSFGDTIQLGDLELRVRQGGGSPDGLILDVRNLVTGETARLAAVS